MTSQKWRKLNHFSAIAVILIVPSAFGIYMAHVRASNQIQLDVIGLSLGDVWYTDAYEHALTVKNLTGTEITLEDFRASCNCTKISPSRLIIPPHGSRAIACQFDFSPNKNGEPLLPHVEFGVDLVARVHSARRASFVNWRVQGTVHYPVEIPKSFTNDERIFRQSSRPYVCTLRLYDGFVPTSATCDSKIGTVSTLLGTDQPDHCQLIFSPNLTLPPGNYDGRLLLELRNATSSVTAPVRYNFAVIPDVYCVPSPIVINVVDGEKCEPITVTCSARSKQSFEITSITNNATPSQIEMVLVPPTSSNVYTFNVSSSLVNPGTFQELFVITATRSDGISESVQLPAIRTFIGAKGVE